MQDLQIKNFIFRAVLDNPDVSKKRLAWALSVALDVPETKVDDCISQMMENRQDLVRSLNYFKVPESRTRKSIPVILLRINPRNKEVVESIFASHQQVHGYEVQSLKLGGVKNGSNALEKVGVTGPIPDSAGR